MKIQMTDQVKTTLNKDNPTREPHQPHMIPYDKPEGKPVAESLVAET
jgi:hypothetical protein